MDPSMSDTDLSFDDRPFKSVGDAAKRVLADIAAAANRFRASVSISELTQSPIEQKLIEAILDIETQASQFELWQADPEDALTPQAGRLLIAPQRRVGRYVLDFAMIEPSGRMVAVECDGHEFHERTKEQAAHDRFRDRYLTSRGWLVARFTGSEIHKNPWYCAKQVAMLLRGEEIT